MKRNFILPMTASLFLLGFFVTQNAFARPQLSDFPYERNIIFTEKRTPNAEISIPMGQDILQVIHEKFNNVQISDQKNNPVPFTAYFQTPATIKTAKTLSVSSTRIGQKDMITDGNLLNTFGFDKATDRKNKSWVLIDLGRPYTLAQMRLTKEDAAIIRGVSIEAGLEKNNLKKIITNQPLKWQYLLPSNAPVRFVKVLFQGTRVDLNEIQFFSGKNGELYFKDTGAQAYYLHYGGDIKYYSYEKRIPEPQKTNQKVILGKQKWNKLTPKDFDNDGVLNEKDNCPFATNSGQNDDDKDGIGDVCDNAKEVKNYNQRDTDADGIGNVIDNCPLKPNPDQANKDGDQYGDACDGANAEYQENNNKIILLAVLGIVLISILGWYFTRPKPQK